MQALRIFGTLRPGLHTQYNGSERPAVQLQESDHDRALEYCTAGKRLHHWGAARSGRSPHGISRFPFSCCSEREDRLTGCVAVFLKQLQDQYMMEARKPGMKEDRKHASL